MTDEFASHRRSTVRRVIALNTDQLAADANQIVPQTRRDSRSC